MAVGNSSTGSRTIVSFSEFNGGNIYEVVDGITYFGVNYLLGGMHS